MQNNEPESFDIGEFASFKLVEDPSTNTFTITVQGPVKYADLFASKIGDMRVTSSDLAEWS